MEHNSNAAAKYWCFTLNNPDARDWDGEAAARLAEIGAAPEEVERARAPIPRILFDPEHMTYLVYQLEIGESGTEHYQGYVEFAKKIRFSQAKKFLQDPRMHVEKRGKYSTSSAAAAYCKKEDGRVDGPWEYGVISKGPGKRTDLEALIANVKAGASYDDIFEEYPELIARYPRFVDEVLERQRNAELPDIPFVPRDGWQVDLAGILGGEPDGRAVLWYWDAVGETGKSTFASSFAQKDAYVVTGGKHADVYYAYRYQRIVIFDWARDSEERFPYGLLESFKNGYFLNTKYVSRTVRFQKPHVVVFANFHPDTSKLSHDRWQIKEIS